MAQPCITNFFSKRKRAAEDIKRNPKVLVLDQDNPTDFIGGKVSKLPFGRECGEGVRDVLYRSLTAKSEGAPPEEETEKRVCDAMIFNSDKRGQTKGSAKRVHLKTAKSKSANLRNLKGSHGDIRLAFKSKDLNETNCSMYVPMSKPNGCINVDAQQENTCSEKVAGSENRVVFELLGGLSPQKKKAENQKLMPDNLQTSTVEIADARKELGLMTPKKMIQQKQKEISLNEIKEKLSRSSRLAELKESLKRFNKAGEQLQDLQAKKIQLEAQNPQLQKFQTIDVVVDISPQKISVASPVCSPAPSPLKSPLASPLKSPLKPAYQRLGFLAQPGLPTLVLPFSYRNLAEMFRCSDTVTSMFYNRREGVTFHKLKAAVQEMLRRNFLEKHLGQIKRVYPKAYAFCQEKCGTCGPGNSKYELIVTPIIEKQTGEVSKSSNGYPVMTPSVLVERREVFHRRLLDIVKDHHEVFLKTLDPPVQIPRAKLTRWHPHFDLEQVPCIEPEALPQPPDHGFCSAQDVLGRAKDLFRYNPRMEKALQKVVEETNECEEQKVTGTSGEGGDSQSETNSLLKGIPKALLEKVRARQAARAQEAMVRTAVQHRDAMRRLRLPEVARVLRSLFAAEKRSVLPLHTALAKLALSCRESLSAEELEQHVRLLMKVTPGWLEIHHVRQSDYLKMSRNSDVSAVIKKLELLATENNQNL